MVLKKVCTNIAPFCPEDKPLQTQMTRVCNFFNQNFFLNLYSALFQCFSPPRGTRSDPRATAQIQPRPRRAFDVRAPLSPLNPWRQNTQLLERVGKDNKQVGAFHYVLGVICRVECPSIPRYSVGNPLGFLEEPSGTAVCVFAENTV